MVLDSNLENGVDFISKMPDLILELILQGLPTTEVIGTSILSKRWRYLWTSIPHFPSLNIDFYHPLRPPNLTYEQAEPLINFVSWALANKTVDLDSFRLCCAGYFETSTVEMFIKAAVNRNVKSLDMKFYPKCWFAAGLVGLKRLKVLELNNVYCDDCDSVEKFLEKCPLLEDLSLIGCLISIKDPICISSSKLKTLIIRNWKNILYGHRAYFWCGPKVCCPKLVSFEYVGRRCEVILEEVDSLKKAVIHPEDMLQQKYHMH
ncbi:F-box domain containing protein [Tanacetum coccineum]